MSISGWTVADLGKDRINQIFAEATEQVDYVLGLYKEVVPYWDRVDAMNHYPVCSQATTDFIFQKAIEFDKMHHPNVMAGGAWMNNGFSYDKDIPDWEVWVDDNKITYKEETND